MALFTGSLCAMSCFYAFEPLVDRLQSSSRCLFVSAAHSCLLLNVLKFCRTELHSTTTAGIDRVRDTERERALGIHIKKSLSECRCVVHLSKHPWIIVKFMSKFRKLNQWHLSTTSGRGHLLWTWLTCLLLVCTAYSSKTYNWE